MEVFAQKQLEAKNISPNLQLFIENLFIKGT